jgi:hypothetical protein
MTLPAQRRIRRSSTIKATSPAFASWVNLQEISLDSDSDVSDDLSFKSLSLRVTELENALCNQDK